MGPVESKMLAYLKRRLDEGALSVPASEILDAVIPPDHPEFRYRPAYRYGLDRLHVRSVINAIDDGAGARHYFIGPFPSQALRESLGL
jgi:hypothetical protein